ncbi:MAG: bacterial transcriptional activator domain-containing protein, partial [Gemmatimonadaceae bacterium]|nr:bacterial transcriptional activator domain-containing protein [Gemmatimonadaceae bacterium]
MLDASHRRDYLAVVQLYVGEFLPRMELLDAPAAFAQWIERERAHLRRTFLEAARRVAENGGTPSVSLSDLLHVALRLEESSETDEASWMPLLIALARSGQNDEALHVGKRLRHLIIARAETPSAVLQEQLRVVGATWTSASARGRPGDGSSSTTAGALSGPLFIARGTEVSVIDAAWARALKGTVTHLHILSPIGLGKTALLDHVRHRLRRSGGGEPARRTVKVGANQGKRDVPFQFAADVINNLARREGGLAIDAGHAAALVTLSPALSDQYTSARPLRGTLDELHQPIALAIGALLAELAS